MKLQVPALPVSVAEDQTELIEIRSNIKRRRSFAPQAPRVIKTPEQMRVERANINALEKLTRNDDNTRLLVMMRT